MCPSSRDSNTLHQDVEDKKFETLSGALKKNTSQHLHLSQTSGLNTDDIQLWKVRSAMPVMETSSCQAKILDSSITENGLIPELRRCKPK